MNELRDRRVQYETLGLDVLDVDPDPVVQWITWYEQAAAAGVAEPNAMTVATVDVHGAPDARVLLAREFDSRGVAFFTNYESAKSHQLTARPVAAAVFAWLDLHRQVRLRGRVERVADAESDAYFATRPRGSQIGAWASPQSEVIRDRGELDRLVTEVTDRFGDGEIERPAFWGGWRIVPDVFEFWQGRPNRLHDRIRYRRADDATWHLTRLAP